MENQKVYNQAVFLLECHSYPVAARFYAIELPEQCLNVYWRRGRLQARKRVSKGATSRASAEAFADADEVDRLLMERDAFEQTMYEVNRQAAWLAQERQNLLQAAGRQASEMSALTAELSWSEECARNLASKNDELQKRLDAVNSSLSWRLTAAFRDWHRRIFRKH